MGKSWLLTELARRLARAEDQPHLVGFSESMRQTPDLLLRSVVDLYSRWLADAGYRQQAAMAWEHQKSNVLLGVAQAVTRMIKEAGQIAKPITGIVEDALNGLIAANQTEAETLVLRVAQPVKAADPIFLPNAALLAHLVPICGELGLSALSRALCHSAATLLGGSSPADVALMLMAPGPRPVELDTVAPLLAMGLFNTLVHAKAEDDLARRDALLAELRALAGAHPADAAVREQLAGGLAKTMLDAADEGILKRQADLWEDLDALPANHAEDGWVEQFRSAGLL